MQPIPELKFILEPTEFLKMMNIIKIKEKTEISQFHNGDFKFRHGKYILSDENKDKEYWHRYIRKAVGCRVKELTKEEFEAEMKRLNPCMIHKYRISGTFKNYNIDMDVFKHPIHLYMVEVSRGDKNAHLSEFELPVNGLDVTFDSSFKNANIASNPLNTANSYIDFLVNCLKKVITPDMGVDQELIDFGKKVLAKAIKRLDK